MLIKEIEQKIKDIRQKWLLKNETPDDDFKLLNIFFNDIYTETQDNIFLCFTKHSTEPEHTYYAFKSSIICPTYQTELTVPFWFYCKEFINTEYDVFIVPNMTRYPKKRKTAISQSNCLFCDIDDKNVDFLSMTKDELKDYLNNNYELTKTIMPAYVTVSGHGLHLYFVTETKLFYDKNEQKYNNDVIDERQQLERSLIAYFDADVKCADLPHEMRLPFSYNHKNNECKKTKLLCFDKTQYLSYEEMSIYKQDDEFVDNYFTTQNHLKHSKNKNSTTRTTKAPKCESGVIAFDEWQVFEYYSKHKLYKTKSSTMNTILDLEDFYNARKGFTGFRKDFFFIYVLRLKQYGFDQDECLCRCYDLNNDNDMTKEIDRIIAYHYEHDYKITNLKIHEHLKFTQFEINCFRCAYTKERQAIDKKKRLKRLSDKRKKQRNVKERKDFQIDLIKNNPEMSRQDLADILGVSIRTISNIRKQLQEAC